jgi:putative membrane-bound dehydrogenase-like protein
MKSTLPLLLTLSSLPVLLHAAPAKPVFASHRVTPETVGHAVEIKADLSGAKKLYLVVTDGGDGFGCDWTNWVNPVIKGNFGEKKLTELKPGKVVTGWGELGLNKNAGGNPMRVDGKDVTGGLGVHAPSVLEFDLPEGTTSFTATGALDEGGTKQGGGSTVEFQVYTQAPPAALTKKSGGNGGGGALEPEPALAALTAGAGLKAETFAAEPMLLSPSSIDVDHLGRVWVAEIVNYRSHNGKRPSGDRILVLEDSDKDGKADKQTVFYEGTDIVSPHGVTVLGNRVIVAANGSVFAFTDDNGDLKSDRKEVLFTGIKGAQHDHSIHAFHFGPDGKYYFNFGNESGQLKDKDGKAIVDKTGNTVNSEGKPYRQGMIFRCDPDGSNVETLAWNFRNNWEVAVDSFGTLWQSDNDDDGNQSVRINYVMPYGNYGFKDELTGAAWSKGDAKSKDQIVSRHWHQTDPGVVPNLLNTGAGSPTGIVVYEGDLLPSVFHNQMIHCDAGPNIVRSYPVKKAGAGYTAETVKILEGTGDRWFRPSDVSVAPDGSLIIADWYDPGVGGHAMGDLDRGRIYRVTPEGHAGYQNPAFDLKTAEGAIAALSNANEEARYQGYTALKAMGEAAVPALEKLAASDKPHLQARALWLLAQVPGKAESTVAKALADKNEDLRITGLRIGLQHGMAPAKLTVGLAKDPSAAVRREAAISLRFDKSAEADAVWATLASQHDGKDRWAIEALGIGADLSWDGRLAAYLKAVPAPETNPGGRDVLWRSRAKDSAAHLAKIIKGDAVPEAEKDRFMRAFDYQPTAEKDKALESLLQ